MADRKNLGRLPPRYDGIALAKQIIGNSPQLEPLSKSSQQQINAIAHVLDIAYFKGREDECREHNNMFRCLLKPRKEDSQ